MPKRVWRGIAAKRFWAIPACGLLAACTFTVPIKPVFEEPPLFPQIQARVGSACRIAIHKADYFENSGGEGGVFHVDFDRASQTRFEQVFQSLFAEVTPLPPWPPWRETPPDLDGVIELDAAELKASLGDDMGRSYEQVVVEYRVCLYSVDGATIGCWESRAEQKHQRAMFERFTMPSYLGTLVEATSREAIARFMLAFEADPAVMDWAGQVARRSDVQP
jgi:hypothetical protein